MKIAFIGLGRMGAGMAANLLKAGHAVTVFNRSRDKAADLLRAGALAAADPAAAADGAEAAITMLADDAATEAVAFGPRGLLAGLAPGAAHVAMGTISVALSERLAEAHEAAGQGYAAAPVFGRPDAAAAAKLFIVAAGAAPLLGRLEPLFAAMGQRMFVMGATPSTANLVKLSGNFLLAATIEALAEAFALVRKAGVDPEAYLDLLTNSLFTAPVHRTYGGLIAARRYEPAGFAAPLGLKDIRLALAAADREGVPMPLASLLRDHLMTVVAQGGGGRDWSALGDLAARNAGMDAEG
jgi:3-hydroxyisobutyrate dehydrogenase-like beta-hydroxyacid dehydrogenase